MSFIWMIIFIALIVCELMTVNLMTIWFAIGALASFIASFWIKKFVWQMTIFVIVSLVSLLLTKKYVKNIRSKQIEATNLDRVIGKIGIVTETISKLEPGEVKVDGKKWSAISTQKINVGSKVEILSIDGVKLNVREIKEEN